MCLCSLIERLKPQLVLAHPLLPHPDIDDPIQPSASAAGGGGASSVDEGAISMVAEMGFSPAQARKALRETVSRRHGPPSRKPFLLFKRR